MSTTNTPNFGELLAPFIAEVPPEALPNFLALLERGAAERYRLWAADLPRFSEGLLACADSEDEIADIVESLYPINTTLAEAIQQPLPAARELYYKVFEGMPVAEQLAIQAGAELQGAAVWQGMLQEAASDEERAGLNRCSALEQESSAYLSSILEQVRNG